MASRTRRSAGDRVLESKHVIGLFLLMLLFSGVFFSLGYVMGRNQYDGQVRAATTNARPVEPSYVPKSEPVPKKRVEAAVTTPETDASDPDKVWVFSKTGAPADRDPHLDPEPKPSVVIAPSSAKSSVAKANVESTAPAGRTGKISPNPPLIPSGSVLLQVAALKKQDDALALAGTLQKRHFAAYVSPPQKDKLYRVQVGPFKDQTSADTAKKGLETAGFKAFVVKH